MERYFLYFICSYIFLSGFIFFEPSLAEVLTLMLSPLLLLAVNFNMAIVLLFCILLIHNVAGLLVGLHFGWVNVKYFVIDIYLYFCFLFLCNMLNSVDLKKAMPTIMKSWAFAGMVNIFACVLALLSGKKTFLGIEVIRFGIRFTGFFKDPNVFGPFLIVPLLFFLESYLNKSKKLNLYVSIFLLFGVIVSFSRAAWLNVFFGVSLILKDYFFSSFANFAKKFMPIVLIIALIFIFLLASDVTILNYNIKDVFISRLGLQSYDKDRFGAQEAAIDMLKINLVVFFLGIGPGNYEKVTNNYSAHSLFMRTLGERGVAGSLLLILIIIVSLYILFKKSKDFKFLFASMVGLIINSFFIDTWHWRSFWILLAIILSLNTCPFCFMLILGGSKAISFCSSISLTH
jgi:hypothetical protein